MQVMQFVSATGCIKEWQGLGANFFLPMGRAGKQLPL
jgi:hypothetical protein